MIDPKHLLEYVIRPVLHDFDLWSLPAEQIVLGTACQESECGRWLVQLGGGPAMGIYQMEPATHDDIWKNYGFIKKYEDRLFEIVGRGSRWPESSDMIGNLYYATAMCRIHYLRDPEPIPDYLAGQAQMWKRVYNTEKGAGTAQDYRRNWNRFIKPDVFV